MSVTASTMSFPRTSIESGFEIVKAHEIDEGCVSTTTTADESSLSNEQSLEDTSFQTSSINICRRELANHAEDTCAGEDKCDLCRELLDGLSTLCLTSSELAAATHTLRDRCQQIVRKLSTSLKPHFQKAFVVLLNRLLGKDWSEHNSDDFEVSPVVWLLFGGPQDLVLGGSVGKSTLDVCLEAEEASVETHEHGEDYVAEKEVLKDFAVKIYVWGHEVKRTLSGGEETV